MPIAPFEIVEIPEEILEYHTLAGIDELGSGPAFGSREKKVTEVTFSGIDSIPKPLQQDILVFDWWIRNGDRQFSERGGNPNLFWDPPAAELVVIDHNQAFDFDLNKDLFSKYHIFSKQTEQLSADFYRREEYNARLAEALSHWKEIIESLPAEWWFIDMEMTIPTSFDQNRAFDTLIEFTDEGFWTWR